MTIPHLALALSLAAGPAFAGVSPEAVRPSTICSAFLDRVEDAGELVLPRMIENRLIATQLELDRGIEASRARRGRLGLVQRLRQAFRAAREGSPADWQVFRGDDVAGDELGAREIFVRRRIDRALEDLRDRLGGSDRQTPVRRVIKGRVAIETYLDEMADYSLAREKDVRRAIVERRAAAAAKVDEINLAAHERVLNLRERRGLETEPREDEPRFGPSWRARWFGPSTDLSPKRRAQVFAAYGAGSAAGAALGAFFAPITVPAAIGGVALGGWFGLRYHLYHAAEKIAVGLRAEAYYRRWKHWDVPGDLRTEARAPRAEGWLRDLADLRDFAARTDAPNGLAFQTRDVDLPLDSQLFGTLPPLDGQNIRAASAHRNPKRFWARRLRVTQVLEFDDAREPVLTTVVSEIPTGLGVIGRRAAGFAMFLFTMPF